MKNIQIPSVLKYAKALALLFVFSFAVSFAVNAGDAYLSGSLVSTFALAGKIFLVLIALNVLLGRAMSTLRNKVAFNDTLVINDTSYAGTVAPYFILPALFNFDTVVKKAVYLKDGIKKQHTIPTMDFSGPLQPRVATLMLVSWYRQTLCLTKK